MTTTKPATALHSPMSEAVAAARRLMVAGIEAQRGLVKAGFAAMDSVPDPTGVRRRTGEFAHGMLDLGEQHVTSATGIAEEFMTGLEALLTPASTAPTDPVAAARSGTAVTQDVVDLHYDTSRRYLELAGRTAETATGLLKHATGAAAA